MSNRYSYAQKKLLSSLVSFPPNLTKTNFVFYKIQKHISWFSSENQEYLEKIIEAIRNDVTLDIHWQQLSNLDVYLNDLSDKDVGVDLEKSYEFLKKQREFFLIEAVKEKGQSITNKQWMEEARRVLKETEEVEDIKLRNMEQIGKEYINYFITECERPKDLMDFGIESLDKRIKIGAGLHIIAGESNNGKTKLGVQLLSNYLLKNDKPCVMFSLEQNANEVLDQIISQVMEINFSKVKRKDKGSFNDEEMTKITGFFSIYQKKFLEIFDMARMTKGDIETVIGVIRKVKFEKEDLGLVVVDYAQLLRSAKVKSGEIRPHIVEVSRILRLLAGELKIPIILLAQAGNPNSKQFKTIKYSINDLEYNFKIYSSYDLAESSSLVKDADTVLFIQKSMTSKIGMIQVAKCKDGIVDPTETQDKGEIISHILTTYNSGFAKFEDCKEKYVKINK